MLINGKELVIAAGADLQGADLRGADFRGADLQGADLQGADLRGANLRGADLQDADLQDADLRGANLRGSILQDADLKDADLRGADLQGADLRDADLRGAKNIPVYVYAVTSILPAGDLIGWKKLAGGSLCELHIPAGARRSNATGRKCRAEYAIVLSGKGVSLYDKTFKYTPGLMVVPREPFDDDRWNECGSGIHFFITKEEAGAYR